MKTTPAARGRGFLSAVDAKTIEAIEVIGDYRKSSEITG